MTERIILCREEIERAARREGFTHPIMSVFENLASQLTPLNQTAAKITEYKEHQRFVRENYGFLVDAVEASDDFALGPLDLLGIWSYAISTLPLEGLAASICLAYGIREVSNPDIWKGTPRIMFEGKSLPEAAKGDNTGKDYVKRRMAEISQSLNDLGAYTFGTGSFQEIADLTMKVRSGDAQAQKRIDEIIAYQKDHSFPLIDRIRDNFSNGILPALGYIGKL